MSDEILVKYSSDVKDLQKGLKTIQTEMAITEKAGVDAAKNTEQAFVKTEGATKSLKAQLRELKAQLAVATDPKDIERLAKAAGKLTDQMQDASEAVKVFASESKFEQIGTAIGGVVGKLKNLDFKGALDQSKLLLDATKSLTFKDAVQGVKDLGRTLTNVGKSLLLNPIFLIGVAIYAVGDAFKSMEASAIAVGEVFKNNADAVNKIKSATNDLAKANRDLALDNDLLAGKISETNAKKLKNQNEFKDKYIEIEKAQRAEVDKLNEEINAKKEDDGFKMTKKIFEFLGGETDLTKAQKIGLKNIEEAYGKQKEELRKKFAENDKKNRIESHKKESDELKKHLEELQKIKDEASKRLAQLSKSDVDSLEMQKADAEEKILITKSNAAEELKITYDKSNKTVQDKANLTNGLLALEEKYNLDIKALRDKDADDAIKKAEETAKAEKEIKDKNLSEEEKAQKAAEDALTAAVQQGEEDRKKITQATIQTLTTLYNDFAQIQQNQFAQQIQNVNDKRDIEIEALDTELKHKTISQKEYDKKKKQIEDKSREDERKLKKEAFEAQKEAAIVSTLINTATAIVAQLSNPTPYVGFVLAALAAASGAAQIAVIESQPTPKFEKGGKVKGQRHYAGGTMIEAEKDEWIIKRDEAIKNDSLLSAINKGQTDKFIYTNYVAPALKAQIKKNSDDKQKSFADSLASSMMFNFKDENLLDSLKLSRKNDKEIAKYLVSELRGVSTNARRR